MQKLHLMVIATALIFALVPFWQVKIISALVFTVIGALTAGFAVTRQLETIKVALFPGKMIPFEKPELKDLATRMNVKLHKKQPLSVTNRKDVKAYTNIARRKVIFGL